MSTRQRVWGRKFGQNFSRLFVKIQEEKSELNLNLAHEKDAVKTGELTEKEAEAMMVTFRKEAGAMDKDDTDYRAIAKRLKEACASLISSSRTRWWRKALIS